MDADITLINAITDELKRHSSITKAVLFGSRARGTNSTKSDYDIAVFGDIGQTERSLLRLELEENLPTLHKIDLVFVDKRLDAKLAENIRKEGISIYGA